MTEPRALMQTVPKRDLIEGLIKGIDVIQAFNGDARYLSANEVAQRTGMTRTAARRYLLTMVHTGLALSDGKVFWLTPKVLNLGRAYLDSAHFPRAVLPFLQKLSQQVQESTNFAELDGSEVVYLSRVIAPHQVTAGFEPGTRLPAHTSTAGRVLLATLPGEQLRAYLDNTELVPYNAMTVTDKNEFLMELQQIREQGYGISENQYEVGMRGLSVAVRNRHGILMGAISVSMSISAASRESAIARCVPALQNTANTLMMWI